MANDSLDEDHLHSILIMQRKILQSNIFPDVKLVFSGGDFLLAHRAILAMNSDFFEKCLKSIPITLDSLTTLILPDLNKKIMKKILDFLYVGEVVLESCELTDFFENKNFFGIKSDSFDCIIKNETIENRKSSEIRNLQNLSNSDQKQCDGIKTEKEIVKKKNVAKTKFMQNLIENESSKNNSKTNKIVKYKFSKIDSKNSEDSITTLTYNLEASELSDENVQNKSLDCYGYTLKNPNCASAEEIEIDEIDYDNNEYEDLISTSDYQEQTSEERNFTIEEAAKDILERGISVTKAAKIYNFPKTALWRRVKHDPRYKSNIKHSFEGRVKVDIIAELCERLKKRERLQSISNSLNIPISTLHWYKVRLIRAGLLPESLQHIRSSLRSDQRLRKNLEKAIEACKMGMIQNKAAKKFGVSRATLFRRMKQINTEE